MWSFYAPDVSPSMGTSLPANPVDGQEFTLVDSMSAPTYSWKLRYVSAKASNKWVFVGGSASVPATTGSMTTSTTAYADLTSGPTIVIPVAGMYLVEFGVQATRAASAIDDSIIQIYASTTGAGATTPRATTVNQFVSVRIIGWERFTMVASETLKLRVKTNNAVSTTFADGSLALTPVAIGG